MIDSKVAVNDIKTIQKLFGSYTVANHSSFISSYRKTNTLTRYGRGIELEDSLLLSNFFGAFFPGFGTGCLLGGDSTLCVSLSGGEPCAFGLRADPDGFSFLGARPLD